MAVADAEKACYLLKAPLEIRWEIYGWILLDNDHQVSSLEKPPLFLSSGRLVKFQDFSTLGSSSANKVKQEEDGHPQLNSPEVILSMTVNHQIYDEVFYHLFAKDVAFCAGSLRFSSVALAVENSDWKTILPLPLLRQMANHKSLVRSLSLNINTILTDEAKDMRMLNLFIAIFFLAVQFPNLRVLRLYVKADWVRRTSASSQAGELSLDLFQIQNAFEGDVIVFAESKLVTSLWPFLFKNLHTFDATGTVLRLPYRGFGSE